MTVDHVKSTAISNADATPAVPNTTGEGASGYLREVSGYATALASSSADATYRLVRVPTTVKVKSIIFESEAQAAGKFDVGVYYPTIGTTGKADLAANAVDQDFFASIIDCASAVVPTEIVNESGTNTLDKRNQPLWQAVGLSSDPTGYFDIVATVKTTAVTTGTGKLGVSVRYVD